MKILTQGHEGKTVRKTFTSAWSGTVSQRMTSVSHSTLSLEGVNQKKKKNGVCLLCEVNTELGELQVGKQI